LAKDHVDPLIVFCRFFEFFWFIKNTLLRAILRPTLKIKHLMFIKVKLVMRKLPKGRRTHTGLKMMEIR